MEPAAPPLEMTAGRLRRTRTVFSASLDRRPEDIGVVAVVIAELELRHTERHVFAADLVESVTHPEARRCGAFSIGATVLRHELRDDDSPRGFHAVVLQAELDEMSLTP